MEIPPPAQIIAQVFPGIQSEESDQLIAHGVVKKYPANVILCHENALEDTFYILLDGEVRVTKTINDMEDRLLKTLSPGGFFGEMAIIHNAPRAATVSTTQPTTVLEIRKEDFNQVLQRSGSVSLTMAREISRRLRENDQLAVDDLRERAAQLASAYQQLAEQDLARREFLTTIAHELRTPLTVASGFLQVVQSGMLEGEALKAALGTVSQNVQKIIGLVNDILFLQEMDLILEKFQPVMITDVLHNLVDELQPAANQAQTPINFYLPAGLPAISGDIKSLKRAMHAVIENAIKFSPEGGEILVRGYAEEDNLFITIQDHGVGIPPEALPRVFERFFHLDEINGQLFGGVGLGLSIAQKVIHEHAGNIQIQSALGEGTLVTIQLPRSNSEAPLS
ncbi:MAG: ATP-binding protein [Anaerolineaceae bacterium]